MRSSIISAVIVILVIAAFIGVTSTFYILNEGQQAIIVQFGRPVGDTITNAGLHIKIPFIQEVRTFEKRPADSLRNGLFGRVTITLNQDLAKKKNTCRHFSQDPAISLGH